MSWKHVDYQVDRGVATLTFARPERLNALTFEVYEDLSTLTASLVHDGDVRALVITGSGRGFCSGGDVDAIMGPLHDADMERTLAFTRLTCEVIRNIRRMPQPVIAAVNGAAAGAGSVIALASDLRICGEKSSFHFLFTKVGLTGADMGAAWMLPRLIGDGRAMEALLFGDRISAEQALAWGLANRVVAQEQVVPEAQAWARRLADGPQEALRITKRAVRVEADMSFEGAMELEISAQATLLRACDHREFYTSHVEGRPPRWSGSSS